MQRSICSPVVEFSFLVMMDNQLHQIVTVSFKNLELDTQIFTGQVSDLGIWVGGNTFLPKCGGKEYVLQEEDFGFEPIEFEISTI